MDLIPEGSICAECPYLIVRRVIPLDPADWEVVAQDDEDDQAYYHVSCSVLQLSLVDHAVVECNYFDAAMEDEDPMMGIRRFLNR